VACGADRGARYFACHTVYCLVSSFFALGVPSAETACKAKGIFTVGEKISLPLFIVLLLLRGPFRWFRTSRPKIEKWEVGTAPPSCNVLVCKTLFPLFLFRNGYFRAFFCGIHFHFPNSCEKSHFYTSFQNWWLHSPSLAALLSSVRSFLAPGAFQRPSSGLLSNMRNFLPCPSIIHNLLLSISRRREIM